MSTCEKQRVDKKTSIERYVGQSLYNNKWTNSKWTNGVYYYGPEAVVPPPVKPVGHNRKAKKQNTMNGSQDQTSGTTDKENVSSWRSSKRTSRHSSGSSMASDQFLAKNSENSTDQKLDARSLLGVGFIAAGKSDGSSGSGRFNPDFLSQKPAKGKRRRNKKSPPQVPVYYPDTFGASNPGPWSGVCTNECYYYCKHQHAQVQIPFGDSVAAKNLALVDGDGSSQPGEVRGKSSGSVQMPLSYYFIMEATYSFTSNLASNYEHRNLAPPPEREWLPVQNFDEPQLSAATITSMSYNVLCDKYASSSLYAYCPPWALHWDYRKRLILQQLKKYDPDVITLQEVEMRQYWTFFKPKLEAMGYAGTFSARSRVRTMRDEEKQSVDGCALFWKAEKFQLQKEHVIEFTQLAIAKAEGSEHMLNRVMTRDNIALAAVLQFRPAIARVKEADNQIDDAPEVNPESLIGTPFVICSTHIHWDPEFCDVKLVQSMMLAQELSAIMDRTAHEYDLDADQIPLLICGDLNSTEDSSVYEFLTTGCIDSDHEDFKNFRGQTCLQKLSTSRDPDSYSHDLQLKSAYDIGMMPFTNYTHDFKGVIDYIFASPNLVSQNVLGPLDVTWFEENDLIAAPCPHVPSDHIPLVVQFGVIPPVNTDRMSISDTQSSLTDDST